MTRRHSRYSPRTGAGWYLRQMTRPNPNANKCQQCRWLMRHMALRSREAVNPLDKIQYVFAAKCYRDRCDGHATKETR